MENLCRIKVINNLNGLEILANDIFDIDAIMVLWGDPKEWGRIKHPSIFQEESEYLKELAENDCTIIMNPCKQSNSIN